MSTHTRPLRLDRRSLFQLAAGAAAAFRSTARLNAQSSGTAISYPAGWNLIAAPLGSDVANAGPFYTLQPGDTDYQVIDSAAGLKPGLGYWAYYATEAEGRLSGSSASPVQLTLPARQWVLVGNPSGAASARMDGAEVVAYTYNPAVGTFSPAPRLAPGQGAWVYSADGTTILLTPAEADRTRVLSGGDAVPSQFDQANTAGKIVIMNLQDVAKYFEPISQPDAIRLEKQQLNSNGKPNISFIPFDPSSVDQFTLWGGFNAGGNGVNGDTQLVTGDLNWSLEITDMGNADGAVASLVITAPNSGYAERGFVKTEDENNLNITIIDQKTRQEIGSGFTYFPFEIVIVPTMAEQMLINDKRSVSVGEPLYRIHTTDTKIVPQPTILYTHGTPVLLEIRKTHQGPRPVPFPPVRSLKAFDGWARNPKTNKLYYIPNS